MILNDFSTGFLSALASFGISSGDGGMSGLPDMNTLTFVNCARYTGDIGEGASYLSATAYNTVFSSRFSYIPRKGGIVIMGAYQLEDWEDFGGGTPRAILRITADNVVIFEGEVTGFFPSKIPANPRTFAYQSSFNIEAKRLNMTDGMALELYQTMIVGYKQEV